MGAGAHVGGWLRMCACVSKNDGVPFAIDGGKLATEHFREYPVVLMANTLTRSITYAKPRFFKMESSSHKSSEKGT